MIEIISGCPGTGKTSLARLLAQRNPKGVHLETDVFFSFVANKVDLSKPDANEQNQAVLKAWCAAAKAYESSGYHVYIDGVIGPWWFDELTTQFDQFTYTMLENDLSTCLERVANRSGQASATADVVAAMHQQFSEIEANYTKHVLSVRGKTLDEVVSAYLQGDAGERLMVLSSQGLDR